MPWQPDHKITTRQRIITSAAELFTQQGFEAVSIDAIMQYAGLTRGAFYTHFKNKAELYQEAIMAGALQAKRILANSDLQNAEHFAQHYLKIGADDSNNSKSFCPLAFFVTDIAHQDTTVKDTYTQALKGYIEILKSFDIDHDKAHQAAILLIGGLAISRAVTDEALKEKLNAETLRGVMAITQI